MHDVTVNGWSEAAVT